MIRFLAIVMLIGAVGGGVYYLFSMEVVEDLKVTGTLQISQQPGSNVSDSQTSEAS
jgi:cell division septal protein FtsQ